MLLFQGDKACVKPHTKIQAADIGACDTVILYTHIWRNFSFADFELLKKEQVAIRVHFENIVEQRSTEANTFL
jgi:hypothetical protein